MSFRSGKLPSKVASDDFIEPRLFRFGAPSDRPAWNPALRKTRSSRSMHAALTRIVIVSSSPCIGISLPSLHLLAGLSL
jgi:hypothetical protein